jgi:glycosyltransferase involved in cell wall biosynthesis
MAAVKRLLVEGWRFIPHSYAVVNQYQCLELLKRPDIQLFHADVPFHGDTWKAAPGSMPPEHESALRSIPVPPKGDRFDAVLRMGFPHRFDADQRSTRVFTWVTDEYKRITSEVILGGWKPEAILPASRADIIACSRWAAQGFLNAGAPGSRVHVIPCGVDTGIFGPVDAAARVAIRKKLGWEGRFVVLNVSAMTGNKGLDLVMGAVARLSGQHPQLALALKGSDTLYSSLDWAKGILGQLDAREQSAVAPRISYQGGVLSAPDIADLYRAADMYLSPYRAEGFNLPVLEAAACGLPVICTRGGSTDDFVDDSWCLRIDSTEITGPSVGSYLVPDPMQLLALLDRAIRDDAWRARASAAGPVWVRERFTWKHTVDKLLEVMFP